VTAYSKCKKVTYFSTYPWRTYFKFPGRKMLRNGLWKNFDQKIWDFTFPSYFSRVCSKYALKLWNAIELVRFLKAKLPSRDFGKQNTGGNGSKSTNHSPLA